MKTETEKRFNQLHAIIESNTPANDSLLGGGLGMAFYYYHLYKIFNNEDYADKALDFIEHAVNLSGEADKTLFGASFSAGGAGMGYLIKTLHDDGLLDMDLEDELSDLDEYLFQSALAMIVQDGNLDYLHGAAGIIYYFSHRLPDARSHERVTRLITAFIQKKIVTENGTWFSNYVMDKDDRTEINFSLSHGQTGFLLILMRAYNKGILIPEIPEIVLSGINQVVHFKRQPKDESLSFFPSTVKNNNSGEMLFSNRLAWCYGDLNILLLLYEASEFLKNPAWKLMANEMAPAITGRKSEAETAVSDAHFCHGSAGLVQVYHRLFELSGLPEYKEASAYWLQKTLELLPNDLEKDTYNEKACNLLEGLVGINLTLVASISEKPVNWGNLFLI
jgi:lantibiotic biosynthesis protein